MSKGLAVRVGQHSAAGRKERNQDFHGVCIPQGATLVTKGIAVALADGISSSDVSQPAAQAEEADEPIGKTDGAASVELPPRGMAGEQCGTAAICRTLLQETGQL